MIKCIAFFISVLSMSAAAQGINAGDYFLSNGKVIQVTQVRQTNDRILGDVDVALFENPKFTSLATAF